MLQNHSFEYLLFVTVLVGGKDRKRHDTCAMRAAAGTPSIWLISLSRERCSTAFPLNCWQGHAQKLEAVKQDACAGIWSRAPWKAISQDRKAGQGASAGRRASHTPANTIATSLQPILESAAGVAPILPPCPPSDSSSMPSHSPKRSPLPFPEVPCTKLNVRSADAHMRDSVAKAC